jgi:catalase
VAWDEAQIISGKDPDFHRRDLWEAIENGNFPEWELGIQLISEEDEHTFEFDLLDPTKLIPEEIIPVIRIGKMTLNRNPDNFFSETEQVAFHPGHLVPGIDFSNDPLLQGRLFSYTDTQLSRLGSPNFHEIPINRPVVPVVNNQRDGHMRQTINTDKVSYHPNSIGNGCPFQAKATQGGFTSYQERIDGNKIRERSKSFFDHFSQAVLFYNSQSEHEKNHIIDAFTFELGKVERVYIQERMVGILAKVNKQLATRVANCLGISVPKSPIYPINHGVPADASKDTYEPVEMKQSLEQSVALSMANTEKVSITTRNIAFLVADGVDENSLNTMKIALEIEGATVKIIAPKLGRIQGLNGREIKVDKSFLTTASVLFDAVYIPSGKKSVNALIAEPDAIHFMNQAYKHCKPIAVDEYGVELLNNSYIIDNEIFDDDKTSEQMGIIIDKSPDAFINAIAQHRFWEREKIRKVPA